MHTVAIIQARLGSTRLPGKVLLPLCGKAMLWHIVQRVRAVPTVSDVCVAMTEHVRDWPIRIFCYAENIPYCVGSERDVLDRLYHAAIAMKADIVVRVTGDCPCVDPGVIAAVIEMQRQNSFDLVGAATGAGAVGVEGHHFPDGLDVECYSFACLARLWREAKALQDREHVSLYAVRNPDLFDIGRVFAPADYGHHRWTVDHAEDFQLVAAIYEGLYRGDSHFTMEEVLVYLKEHPEVYGLNRQYVGQEGYANLWGKHHDEIDDINAYHPETDDNCRPPRPGG